MAGRNQLPLSSLGLHLYVRPNPGMCPRHGVQESRQSSAVLSEDNSDRDLHPVTSCLVTNITQYTNPSPLPGPSLSIRGDLAPGSTVETMRIKPRGHLTPDMTLVHSH